MKGTYTKGANKKGDTPILSRRDGGDFLTGLFDCGKGRRRVCPAPLWVVEFATTPPGSTPGQLL
jgi:hypothetical protein